MTTPRRVMIISVHPRHAERIVSGSKTVELRRTRPAIEPGQPAVIYATRPLGALIATCQISSVETATSDRLWSTVRTAAQVSRDEFDAYFANSPIAVALHLSDVRPLSTHVTLRQLRERTRFHPPQTWHFMNASGIRNLLGGHPSADAVANLITC